jgi:hypothetical protein
MPPWGLNTSRFDRNPETVKLLNNNGIETTIYHFHGVDYIVWSYEDHERAEELLGYDEEMKALRRKMREQYQTYDQSEHTDPATPQETTSNSAPYVTREYIDKKKMCDQRKSPAQFPYSAVDVGPILHEFGRPAEWKSQRMYLGKTCYTASIGPSVYQDEDDEIADYYSIDVEARQLTKLENGSEEETWLVVYRRDFEISDLPEGLLDKNIDDVVEFDEETNSVTFLIGESSYEYSLPSLSH